VAVLTMLFATSVGLMAALALVRGKVRWRQAVLALILSPMIVPTIITAVAFYLAFAPWGASGSILAMALGHTVLALPLVVVLLAATLQGLDPAYERAALSLGASRFYVLRRITVPLVAPGVISSALFAFLFSFDELLVPLFLSGVRAQTLPVRIWNSLLLQVEPTIAAVSAFLIGVTVLVLLTDAVLRGRGRGPSGGGGA